MNEIGSLPWMTHSPWVGTFPTGIRYRCWDRVNLLTGIKARIPAQNANPGEMFYRVLTQVERRLRVETGVQEFGT